VARLRPLVRRVALTVVLVALLAGCGGDDAPRPAAAPATATAVPAPTQAPLPPHRRLHFRATDGTRLTGSFTPAGPRAPAIVLVHEYNGGPSQFDPLIPVLHDAGFATLAYRSRDPAELDEAVLAKDARGAVAAVRARRRQVDPKRVGLVGASIGGTTVSYVIGTRPDLRLRAAVALSPVESGGLITLAGNGGFKPHDLLLIADDHEYTDVENIAMDAGHHGVTGFKARIGGHGVRLLPDPTVRDRLLGWLKARV
jgi:pimeloyl-ACP methyl ester carboxylesterase